MKMRSRSDDISPLDMYTLQSFHTTNIVHLLHKVREKQTKTQPAALQGTALYDRRGQTLFVKIKPSLILDPLDLNVDQFENRTKN